MHMRSTITTVLGTAVFSSPISAASGGFVFVWVVAIIVAAASTTVLFSKCALLEGGDTVVARALLVGDITSFVAGDHFFGDSVVLIEASSSGSSRCSD